MNEIYRKPNRLKYYNYSNAGFYFITICTYERQNLFGEVINGKMVLNDAGIIVEKYLLEIPHVYLNIELDEYIVMPNHEHIILINNKDEEEADRSKMIISKTIQQ